MSEKQVDCEISYYVHVATLAVKLFKQYNPYQYCL